MKSIISLILLIQVIGFAQNSNPREAVINHLANLQPDSYDEEQSAKSFESYKQVNLEVAARRLKKFFDAKGLFIEVKDIPDSPNYFDSTQADNIYIIDKAYPDIYLKKYGTKWKYSEETVSKINNYYKQIFPEEIKNILSNLPESFFYRLLDIELWKWIGIFIYLIIAIILYVIFNKVLMIYAIKLLKKIPRSRKLNHFALRVIRPISILILIGLLDEFYPILQLPVRTSNIFNFLVKLSNPIIITIIVYRFVDLIADVFEKVAEKTESTVDDQLVPLIRKAMKIVVVIIGSFYLIDNLGIDYTPLLAGASVGGLAIALAAQDTMKNFFGSITIFTDKPFDVGDWIVFGKEEGTVEEVGVRSTRVRSFYNSLISIPNGKISDMVVDNMGRRKYRRYKTTLSLEYNSNPESVKKFVEGLKQIVEDMGETRKDYYEIHLNDFGTYSLQILVYIFFEVENWSQELLARQEYIFKSLELAKELNLKFAYPTQNINLNQNLEKDSNE